MRNRSVWQSTQRFSGLQSGNNDFFGLKPEDKEQLILEPAFLAIYYGGLTWTEIMSMPVAYKRWFVERIVKELTKGGTDGEASQSRALHQNSPDVRAAQGMNRTSTPTRLRRFT